MRTIKTFSIVSMMALAGYAGYMCGERNGERKSVKDYQAACILSDACRNMMDKLGADAEEIYHEYVDNLDCFEHIVVTGEDIEGYAMGY